jgi:hypothetical protein
VTTSVFVVAGLFAVSAAPPPASKPVDFQREVRPILSDKCFACHGPAETGRMANLRLDTKEGAFADRKTYHIIKPGDSAASRLYQRVNHEKKPLRMPPPTSGLSLTEREIETLKRWIDEGAKWETHWAYIAPKRPELPAAKNKSWIRNPIDSFILARLEAENLRPSKEAARATLLRRVTLDLTGLPPSPEEIDAFLKDRSAKAYDKVVDRLLASPRYGERMAMHWLDLARYADTHGYHIDSHRDMWPWRDWVIDAFNRNLPYDRFTVEQLAGDLLPNPTTEQLIATGFNRNHMINYEGGAIPEEYLNEYVADRVDTTSTVFLGMTMGCARCHDHKYDPIKHRDYYSMYAFFNRVSEKGLDGRRGNALPMLRLGTPDQQRELDRLQFEIDERESRLSSEYVDGLIDETGEKILASLPQHPRKGLVTHYELDGSFADISGGYRHGRVVRGEVSFGDGPVADAASFNGENAADLRDAGMFKGPFSIAVWLKSGGVNPMMCFDRGEAWSLSADESIPLEDLTRGAHLYFTAGGKTMRTARVYGEKWIHAVFSYDGTTTRAWINGKEHHLLPGEQPIKATASSLTIPRGFKGSIDDLRLYDRALDASEIETLAIHHPNATTLSMQPDSRSKEQKRRLREYFLTRHAPDWERRMFEELEEMRAQFKQLDKAVPTVMVMNEMAKPPETHVLGRGDYRNLGEKVTADVPSALPPMAQGAPQNRLGFAQWLIDPSHPLTARVTVNRFWSLYFGNGLVKTLEDFGFQGESPSHPELLDWLATEFIRSGWDVKALQRLIVTSAAYRQASQATPEMIQRDPENRLLARGPRFRLQAETIRDTSLFAAGLLEEKIGGPSVFPYSPKGLWEDIAFGNIYSAQVYPESKPEDLHRRSMYTFWKRTAPPATLNTFDAPDREKCTVRRPVTNTPLQALAMMNDPTFVEAAKALGERMKKTGSLRLGFRLVTGRVPAAREEAVLKPLLGEPDGWTLVASAILNLDEAITKE